jgi:methylmalonyl-CoA mutase
MTLAVAQGWPRARILKAATDRQARIEKGLDVVVGVNRFQVDAGQEREVDLRAIDNHGVREEQVERLGRIKSSRDQHRVDRALEALVQTARGEGNLLEAVLPAARARATLGEISAALERVWGRHVGESSTVLGAYASHYEGDPKWQSLRQRTQDFELEHGRRPRLLVAKLGQDGHDRGARLVASAFADAGFDVDVGPLFQTPAEVARQALDNDVHAVGVSTQAGGHLTLVPERIDELRQRGAVNVVVVCGGVVPDADRGILAAAGVADVFGPGTPLVESIDRLLSHVYRALDEEATAPAPSGRSS